MSGRGACAMCAAMFVAGAAWAQVPPSVPGGGPPVASPPAPWIRPADGAALERGELPVTRRAIAGSDVPELTVRGLIEAPVEKVWPIIDRCGNYARFMPRMNSSTEVKREGSRVVCRVEIDLPFPLGNLWSVTDAEHREQAHRVFVRRWTLREGNYRMNQGEWELSPYGADGGSTLVSYRLRAQPDSFVPDALAQKFARDGLPDVLRALRRRVAQLAR